jgi:hypothetical protein
MLPASTAGFSCPLSGAQHDGIVIRDRILALVEDQAASGNQNNAVSNMNSSIALANRTLEMLPREPLRVVLYTA